MRLVSLTALAKFIQNLRRQKNMRKKVLSYTVFEMKPLFNL